ncbi:oligosaccharide flippase family protein [Paenibacillus sp. OAS669]|uniref:oligosaccharide flippase family protein n=1 Tax=Paenibacillus sp. OAS669 TaxID=2663821 RepID=UPI001789BEB9|nr:oligosaccharide flippase family protein [Paenibacillus sp. OAS669]MBE1442778.1 stage V sporulation protein B [Paenibacillus sp. OAS669]
MKLPAFIKQTALRSSAIFLIKLIGLAVRIPLFRLLGPEGTGIYQMVYSIYGFALTLISGGFPTSLALMTAKDQERGQRFFHNIAIPFFMLGTSLGILFFVLAPQLAHFFGDDRLTFPLRCMVPALAIVPLLQLYRGYLQGLEYYGMVSVSEMVEQIIRVGTMLLLVILWMNYGIHAAAGGAVFGAFTGACIALGFLIIWFYCHSRGSSIGSFRSVRTPAYRWLVIGPGVFWFIQSSLAITLTRLIVPASDVLDTLIIPNRLQVSGLSQTEAFAMFGEIFGMAATIVYLPTMVTAALSFTTAPKLTADWESGKTKEFAERSNLSLEIGWILGISSMMFLYAHAAELSNLIFGSLGAAEAIRCLAFAPLITGIRELTTTMLWASEQKTIPLFGLLFGLIGSAAAAYYFVAIPGFGYSGAAIGVFTLECIALVWNISFLRKRCRGIFPLQPLAIGTLFLAGVGILYNPYAAFLLYIGAESALARSVGGLLFFAVCMGLYLALRLLGKRGHRVFS